MSLWAGAIAKAAREAGGGGGGGGGGGSGVVGGGGSSSIAGVDVERGGDATKGDGAGELKSSVAAAAAAAAAAAGAPASGKKAEKFTGAQIFGIFVGALGGAAVLAALVGLMWSRQRERKRRQNVQRQVNMTQL